MKYKVNVTYIFVYQEGDIVKQPMKKGSFVPKNVPEVGWEGHEGVGWAMKGWGAWVMKGWGGVGWVMKGWGGSVILGWGGWVM